MFQFFKRLLKKKKSKKIQNTIELTTAIRFKDTVSQDIAVTINPDGNTTVLCITELHNNSKIVLDKEKALLLGVILQEYSKKEHFNDITEIFNKGEE